MCCDRVKKKKVINSYDIRRRHKMKKYISSFLIILIFCFIGCKFDTDTTTNDYDDSELRTRISELEKIVSELENKSPDVSNENEEIINEENVPENEDNLRIIADGDYFNVIDQNGDILYFFSKSDGGYSGYCTKREHYIRVTVSVLNIYTHGVYKSCNIWYTKDEYGNKYILYDNNLYDSDYRDYLFCLRHNKSYSYIGRYISAPSVPTDICEQPDNWGNFKLDEYWAKTPEEFLRKTELRNQNYLINYILNFIESDE
jgi:hypothetical protein